MKYAAVLLAALTVCSAAAAHAEGTPAELVPFVEKGTRLLDFASADLNGDNLSDYVFILEKPYSEEEVGQRPLKIAVRDADGKLHVVKVNDKIIECSECGGMMGDPLVGINARQNTFTIEHYGGSNWRWGSIYEFKYSRRDKTWQLTLIESLSHHVFDAEHAKIKKFRPPKDYGKIDIAEFDPKK
jgi:hypothetical protein